MSLEIMLGNGIVVLKVRQNKNGMSGNSSESKKNKFWKCIRITSDILEIQQNTDTSGNTSRKFWKYIRIQDTNIREYIR